jgi:hypothetical protein
MTHITEEQLVAFAFDDVESGTRAALNAHLDACAECRLALVEIRATLDATAHLDVPERDEAYGEQVWTAIAPRLNEPTAARVESARERATPVRFALRPAVWLAAAAALLLAVGAYWLGRHDAGFAPAVEQAARTAPAREPSDIRERVVLAALGEHLDRTERTLVELVNAGGDGRVDISAEQAWARDLLDANRLYRQAAAGPSGDGNVALAGILAELEPVLLEIANSPSRLTSDEFEAMRDRIEARSLVFKVRVTGADVRARQRALLRDARDVPSTSRDIRRGELQS